MKKTLLLKKIQRLRPEDGKELLAIVIEHMDEMADALGVFCEAIRDWINGHILMVDELPDADVAKIKEEYEEPAGGWSENELWDMVGEQDREDARYALTQRPDPFYVIHFAPGDGAWKYLHAYGIEDVYWLRERLTAEELPQPPDDFEEKARAAMAAEGFDAVQFATEDEIRGLYLDRDEEDDEDAYDDQEGEDDWDEEEDE